MFPIDITPKPQRPQPTRFRFDPLDRIRLRKLEYLYVREDEGGHVLRLKGSQVDESVSDERMREIVRDPSFGLDRGYYAPSATFARSLSGGDSLARLDPEERDGISFKVHYCRTFLELEREGVATRSDSSMETAINSIQEDVGRINARALGEYGGRTDSATIVPSVPVHAKPSAKTLRKWLVRYECSGGLPIALRDGRHRSGNRTLRLAREVYELIHDQCEAYATEKRPTVKACHLTLCGLLKKANERRAAQGLELLTQPSLEALRRAVDRLPKFSTFARRHGIDAARKRFRLVKQSVAVVRPGERVEMDEWAIQLHKILKESGLWKHLSSDERRLVTGRWVICVAVDVATKTILGMQMAPTATGSLAKRTLRMVLVDKSSLAPGAVTLWDMVLSPDAVVTDGGPAFTGTEFVAAVADLRARHDVPPGGMPHLRGTVERLFGSIDTGLLSFFTGRTFSDSGEKGDYNPQDRASATRQRFGKALGIHVADVYHNTPHDGLGGETPRHAWERLTKLYGVCPPPGPDDLRAIFGTQLEREVSLRGVRCLGLHYADRQLGEEILRRGLFTATIRVDEDDIGRISLLTADGWRPLPCRTRGLDGVSAEEFLGALRDVRRRFASAAAATRAVVLDAVARIRAIAAEGEAAAGIELRLLGRERIDAEEHALLSGYDLDLDDRDGDDPDGLDSEVIPVGPRDDPPGDAPQPPAAPGRRYGSEEK